MSLKSRLSYKVLNSRHNGSLQNLLNEMSDEYISNSSDENSDFLYDYMPNEEATRLTSYHSHVEPTTVLKAYFNLTVCILASALLSMPYGFDKSGWLGGVVMLVVVGLLVDYTLQCLGEVCMSLNVYDYQEVAEITFGKPGKYLQAFVQLFLSLSLMISYQIIAAENILNMLSVDWIAGAQLDNVTLRYILVPLLTIFILIPLVTLVTLRVLSYSSMLSVLAIVVLCGSLLYFDINHGSVDTVVFSSDYFTGISVFATGFVCHQIITPTLDSLEDGVTSKKQKFHTVVHMAILTSFLFFAAVGAMGYCLCQGNCPGNILDWSDSVNGSIKENTVGKVAISMFLVTALFAYPLEHFSCYNTLCKLLYHRWDAPSRFATLAIKIVVVVMTTLPALFIQDIGPLIAWAGTLAAFPLGFLLPISISIKQTDHDRPYGYVKLGFSILILCVVGALMLVHTFQQAAEIYCNLTTKDGS